jgi:hypothetical protein
VNTHDNQPFDLGAALHEIAADAGRSPVDPTWGHTTRSRTARRRRRHHILVAATAAAVLTIGGGTWAAIPHLTHDPLPAVTHTPTPSPTPTPTPEPSPTATTTPTPEPPAVPHGYTTESVELPLYNDLATDMPRPKCGDARPNPTGSERLVTANVPGENYTFSSGEWRDKNVPLTLSTPETVQLHATILTSASVYSQDGAVVGVQTSPGGIGGDGDDYVPPTLDGTTHPGQTLTVDMSGAASRTVECQSTDPSLDAYQKELLPGQYVVTARVVVSIQGYSLQQQDGTWGAWQDLTWEKPSNLPGHTTVAPTMMLITNTFTVTIE